MRATTADTPQVLLEHHLKALRLPTMLREYDKLARTCAQEKSTFPQYLLRLTELELLDRDRRATERRGNAGRPRPAFQAERIDLQHHPQQRGVRLHVALFPSKRHRAAVERSQRRTKVARGSPPRRGDAETRRKSREG